MSNLDFHSKHLGIVEKKKIWFIIPLIILVVSIIIGIIYNFVMPSGTLNLGMDFTGGYSLTVRLGNRLDDSTERSEYEKLITEIIEQDCDEFSGLKVKGITMQGEGTDQALRFTFVTEGEKYDYGVMVGSGTDTGIIGEISDQIVEKIFADDIYSGSVTSGDSVSATVSSELLITAICGIIMALALMLIYIAVRFELSSGVIALICLVHDIIMMFLFMMVYHIEITSTFVAALITILGYSINNTIIIFDKVRDNVKLMKGQSPSFIANSSVRETMIRSINTTATTFVTVLCVCIMSAIFSVSDLINFCLPLMAGLLAGTFSSILLAPSMWAFWKEKKRKNQPVVEDAALVETRDSFFDDYETPSVEAEQNVASDASEVETEKSSNEEIAKAEAETQTADSEVKEDAKEVNEVTDSEVTEAKKADTSEDEKDNNA